MGQNASYEEFFERFVQEEDKWKTFLDQLVKMAPPGVPIHTISMEMPGTPSARLAELANRTGGEFSLVLDGKTYTGKRAEKYGDSKHNVTQ